MSAPLRNRNSEAGMSLIEVIVALAIIGVMSGIAVLSIGSFDRTDAPDTEAQRLAARINLAADMALIEGRQISLTWDEHGYSLEDTGFNDTGNAARDTSEPLGGRHDLASSMHLIGPSATGTFVIRETSAAAVASFVVQGRQNEWQVDFNGLAASANPVQAR